MIVASLASLSSRQALLQKTIASLLPQVDAICVYLNGYERVPGFLRQKKIMHAILSVDAGWRGAEAKLWFWDDHQFRAAPAWSPDDVALVCDDDLIYPGNYAEVMAAAIAKRPGSIACVHGSIMTEPFERYSVSRMVARTVAALADDTRVHIPGTGTMAFRVGDVAPVLDLRSQVRWSHAVDPHMAVIANRENIPVWSVARPPRWVVTQPHPKAGMAIFETRTGCANDGSETELLKSGGPWINLPVPADMTPRVAQLSAAATAQLEAPAAPGTFIAENQNSMLPKEAFEWLADKLAELPAGVVVELGSGHGSDILAAMLRPDQRLVSVEHDERFLNLAAGTTYIHAAIKNSWYDADKLWAELPPAHEIVAVIVDGPPGKIGRGALAKHLDLFPMRVPMLIDDVQRPAELALARQVAMRRRERAVVYACGDRAFATVGWP